MVKRLGEICPACLATGEDALLGCEHSQFVERVEGHAKRTVRLLELLRRCESLQVPRRSDYNAAVSAAKRATPRNNGGA